MLNMKMTSSIASIGICLALFLGAGCASYSGFSKSVHVKVVDIGDVPIPQAEVDIGWRHGNPFWPKVAHQFFLTDTNGCVDHTFWHGSFHYVRTVRKPGYAVAYDLSPVFEVQPEQQKSSKDDPVVVKMRETEQRTSGSSVVLTRGTPPAGQESRRGSESAEP